MRTIVYIDGFNLFYGILKGSRYKWLDLKLLSEKLLPKHAEIVGINYYTAMVKGSPGKLVKQEAYIRALKAHIPGFKCILGRNQVMPKYLPKAIEDGRDARGKPKYKRGQSILVLKTEEKKTDVNMAVDIVNDAWLDKYDCAFLISNDSDLAPPLLTAKNKNKRIGIATTSPRPAGNLKNISDFHRHITALIVKSSQLPDEIEIPKSDPQRLYIKPMDW